MCTFQFHTPQGILQEGRIHIISFAKDATMLRTLDIANEYPSQKYALSDKYALYENFSLMVKEGDGYVIWEKVEDFSGSGPEDRHFIFDSREGMIQFGDGRHGLPPAGELRIINYAKCLGASGKVKDNQIREIAKELGIAVEAANQKSSWGGRDEETFEESFVRVQKEMRQPLTAVSYEDYEQYIKHTPGLMIASCKALLPQEVKEIFPYYNDSAVTIVVKPFVKQLKKEVMKIYGKNILAYIEQFRMAGTSVYLVKPEYIHFDVYVDVELESHYVGGEERVKEAVQSFFQEFNYKFGSCVRYSGLYGKLDMLECVRRLYGLSFEVKGTGVKYLPDGSVLAPPNGVVELGQMECQFSMI
jgi:predicted phage baseplate assembly protein